VLRASEDAYDALRFDLCGLAKAGPLEGRVSSHFLVLQGDSAHC